MLQVRCQPWRTSSCCQVCARQSLLVAFVALCVWFHCHSPQSLFHICASVHTCMYYCFCRDLWVSLKCFLLFLPPLFSSVSSPLGCHCVMRANDTAMALADSWHKLCPHVQSWLPFYLCAWSTEESSLSKLWMSCSPVTAGVRVH